MTVDDESVKQITTSVATTTTVSILGFVWLWFTKITSLPRRVERIERRGAASDRLLLALADSSLARAPKDRAEAREALRQARQDMYDSLTRTQGSKS